MISKSKLQKLVNLSEMVGAFEDLQTLAECVAESDWAVEGDHSAREIAKAIVEHNIECETPLFSQKLTPQPKSPAVESEPTPPVPAPVRAKPEKAIKTFDGPGPGRKKCPACSVHVGARTSVCVCGNDFSVNPAVRSLGSSSKENIVVKNSAQKEKATLPVPPKKEEPKVAPKLSVRSFLAENDEKRTPSAGALRSFSQWTGGALWEYQKSNFTQWRVQSQEPYKPLDNRKFEWDQGKLVCVETREEYNDKMYK